MQRRKSCECFLLRRLLSCKKARGVKKFNLHSSIFNNGSNMRAGIIKIVDEFQRGVLNDGATVRN